MDIHDRSCHLRSSVKAAAAAMAADGDRPEKESNNGFLWWRPRRPTLADLSNTSSTSTSIISTSSPPQRPQRHKETSCSSANRLLFDGPATAIASGEGGGAPPAVVPPPQQQQFETQQKQPADGRYMWTRGSRDGTEALSPEEDDGESIGGRITTTTRAAGPPTLFLPAYNNDSAQRRRRPVQEDVINGSSSGKLKSLKLAPTASAVPLPAAATSCSSGGGKGVDWDRPGRSLPKNNGGGGGGGGTSEQRRRWQSEERRRRTLSKPPRPEQASTRNSSSSVKRTINGSVAKGDKEAERGEGSETMVVPVGQAQDGGSTSTHGMFCEGRKEHKAINHSKEEEEEEEEVGMDDDTAARVNTAKEPSVVYDILAVDRGCGYCDTSVVPFPVKEGGQVTAARMRGLTSGQSEFLARRWVC